MAQCFHEPFQSHRADATPRGCRATHTARHMTRFCCCPLQYEALKAGLANLEQNKIELQGGLEDGGGRTGAVHKAAAMGMAVAEVSARYFRPRISLPLYGFVSLPATSTSGISLHLSLVSALSRPLAPTRSRRRRSAAIRSQSRSSSGSPASGRPRR